MATNIDILVWKAKNAPDKKNWRGAPSERQKYQEELLEVMSKKDHWILLANHGLTASIREQAVDKWISEGLGGDDAIHLFWSSKDDSVKSKIVALFGKSGKKRSAIHLWSIVRFEPETKHGTKALEFLFEIAKENPESEKEKAQKNCAIDALKSFVLEQKGDCARKAFDHLWNLDQLEAAKEKGEQFKIISITKNVVHWAENAKNDTVKKASKSLLK